MQIFRQILLIEHIQYTLLSGKSVQQALREFDIRYPGSERLDFSKPGACPHDPLFAIVKAGIEGQSIGESLQSVKLELVDRIHIELEIHLKWLPILTMLPVLLFMFPAFLILLIGPVVGRFLDVLI